MSTVRRNSPEVSAQDLVVTRVFEAPVNLVYETWTRPEHVAHWWMPKGFNPPEIVKLEVRVGGEWRVKMPHSDGNFCIAYGVYREVVKERRLAWDDFCDENGKCFHKAFVTVDFEEVDAARTRVTLRARLEGVPGRDARWTLPAMEQGWVEGWKDNLGVLAGYLPKIASTADRELRLTRDYDAPRELVFKVWTDPKHTVQWWGPNGFTTTSHSMDFRVGGGWRYTMHGPDGVDYPNVTTFLEVIPPERLVYDHGDDENPRMFRATVTFEELDGGRTRLTLRLAFPTAEARDLIVEKHGAVEGGKQTLARLAQYLSKMD